MPPRALAGGTISELYLSQQLLRAGPAESTFYENKFLSAAFPLMTGSGAVMIVIDNHATVVIINYYTKNYY